ncbi:MAG: DUF4282 domain-containing protein [Mesorhizobium sp.]|jgi:hypothetical protein|uniref:DUF4282 domain-containing protein n=1 Tax=Ollibium composti TaxID=2675109 RepID=A0ABY2Q7E5_9HYPH|nr:DUF4282 domain-containing protein [Mesorhizobium composti]THF56322.1 DUF4282 domain-containing protein [Mesorhizobium composti]
MQLSDFFSFEKLITPSVIKIVYWLGIAVLLVFGVASFFMGLLSGSLGAGLLSLVGSVLGLLLWRVMCELYIVIFGMFDRLGQIRDGLSQQQRGYAQPPL